MTIGIGNNLLWIGLSLFLLTGCSYMQHQQRCFTHQKMCVEQCGQRFQDCQRHCEASETECKIKSRSNAEVHFAQYRQQQTVQGQVVMEDVAAFQDPLACRKMTCDCDQDKNMCQQACRDSIHKRLQSAMQLN